MTVWLPPRIIAKTQVGKYWVSTVRLPKREGDRSKFESLIFGAITEDYIRHRDENEAKEAHKILVWALQQTVREE